MSRGVAALQTSRKAKQAGPPFVAGSANNGLSVDGTTGKIVFGNDAGGNLADLLSDRFIDLKGFSANFIDPANSAGEVDILSGEVFVQKDGDAGNTTGATVSLQEGITADPTEFIQTRVGLRINMTVNSTLWLRKSGQIVYEGNTGNPAVENTSDVTLKGSVVLRKRVIDVGDGANPFTGQGNYVYTNFASTAAGGSVDVSNCPLGCEITLINTAGNSFAISGASQTFQWGAVSGGSATSMAAGDSITFVLVDAVNGVWFATSVIGAWV